MQHYLYETLSVLYLFWFKPLTLYRQLTDLSGDPKLLDTTLWSLLRQPERRQVLFTRPKLRRLLGQILLGNLLLLLFGTPLAVWLSDISGLTALMGGSSVNYWGRVARGVAFGMGVGVVFSVVFRVVFGVAGGVTVGVVIGMGRGVAFGVAVGVAGGVAGGVAFGVAFGVATSVARGVSGGVAFGVARGVAAGVAYGVAAGVAAGVAYGVAAGVAYGVAAGVAAGVTIMVTVFRLPLTPFWIVWSLFQWLRVEQGGGYEARAFWHSAISLDELIYVPLPLFDRLLARCMAANPAEATTMLVATARSTGQKWAVAYAAGQWAAEAGLEAGGLAELMTPAERCDAAANILANAPRNNEKVANLLRDLAAIGHSLANINKAHMAVVALQVLDRNRKDLDSLKISAGLLKRNELSDMAEHWQRLIRTHAEQLEQEPRIVVRGAYQAGSALEAGSSLFRGRQDLFALTNEVYANPQRAETLLLIAQQRMGKSSALMQLSAQLPDAHIVIVDCQRAISGTGDDLFAAGISAAINHWEKRCPGGLRQAPLASKDLGKQPLHELNMWLERYADRARGKRILLCLDEFDKLVQSVATGRLSPDVLGLLRGLSQDPGWMLLYSGQFELDDWAPQYAEYLKNVRRVRVSYLRPPEARSLLEEPVPHFGLTWQTSATDAALHWTGCQPFLLQMIGTQVVNRLQGTERQIVTKEDIDAIIPSIFDSGRYYFQSLQGRFSAEENQALQQIAQRGETDAAPSLLHRLTDHEYIQKDEQNGWRFRVPLLREWWRRVLIN